MLKQLRDFNPENTDVDEMIALSAFGRALAAEYAALSLDAPEWLGTQMASIGREINSRLSDLRAKRIREIKARLTTLMTADEKRAALKAELSRLEEAGK